MRAVALGDEFFLGRFGMHQYRVNIARFAQAERLPGAHHQKPQIKIKIVLDRGQQHIRKARIIKRCGHGHAHLFGAGRLCP